MAVDGERRKVMSMIIELVVTSVVVFGGLFMVFLFVFILAMLLDPVERALSKMVWDMTASNAIIASPKPGSFKDFSMRH